MSRVMQGKNFANVGVDDLQRMILLYDREFFDGRLIPAVKSEGFSVSWSSRMTSNAGKTVTAFPNGARGKRKFEIVLSSTLLFQTFRDVQRPIMVTGMQCHNRLEAMQRITEHELVHLLEMFVWNDSSCGRDRFQSIANRMFLHTQHNHQLITQTERAAKRFAVRVGSTVQFDHNGQTLTGRVNRITRRATVLVPDPNGEPFEDGGRYVRFYVPLEHLRVATRPR